MRKCPFLHQARGELKSKSSMNNHFFLSTDDEKSYKLMKSRKSKKCKNCFHFNNNFDTMAVVLSFLNLFLKIASSIVVYHADEVAPPDVG